MTPIVIGRYRAVADSPAAELLHAAYAAYDKSWRLGKAARDLRRAEGCPDDAPDSPGVLTIKAAESAAWGEGKRLEREASTAAGFAGEAVDDRLIATATHAGRAGRCDPEMREALVVAAVRRGEDEAVARRSVIRGLMRGASLSVAPVSAPPAPQPPPVAPQPKRSRWADLGLGGSAA